MTVDEFREALFRLLRREPFQPFEIELDSGEILRVEQPEWVATNGTAGSYWTGSGPLVSFDARNTRRLGSELPTPV